MGGFEIAIVLEELVTDSEAEGESVGCVYDLRPCKVHESHNSPTSTETETSTSPELRSKILSPTTNDVVYLTVCLLIRV